MIVQLQVQHTVFDFLGSSLIPVLCADVAAGAPCHIHLALVSIATLGAYPDQLAVILLNLNFAVIATFLAEIRFGV